MRIAVALVIFLALMAAWRFAVVSIVTTYGFVGFAALVAACYAVAFWWERRFPKESA